MKKIIVILFLFIGFINCDAQNTLIKSYKANASAPSFPTNLALDGNLSTLWRSDYCYTYNQSYFEIEFVKDIQAAQIRLKAGASKIQVDLISDLHSKTTTGYLYTMKNDETFYIVSSEEFNKVRFWGIPGQCMDIYEIVVSEIALESFTANYVYDNGGNMTTRTIVLSTAPPPALSETTNINYSTDIFANNTTVKVFPNPTKGILKFDIQNLNETDKVEFQVYAISGQLLVSKQYASNDNVIDLQSQANGTYFLNIKVGAEAHQWTIIKE